MSYVDDKAKMKESMQKYRKIRVQGNDITENRIERPPLTLRNLLYVAVYMQRQRTQRKLEKCFAKVYKLKYSSSLKNLQ